MKDRVLPGSNIQEPIEKNNLWIVWVFDENYKIRDIEIYDFTWDEENSCRPCCRWVDYCTKDQRISYSDWGASSCSTWHQNTLADVLFKFGYQHEYADQEVKEYFLQSLVKVKEWQMDVAEYLSYMPRKPKFMSFLPEGYEYENRS